MEKTKKNINLNIIFFLLPVCIIIGKIIRYTIMKNVLVDSGIGHYFLLDILYTNPKLSLFNSGSMDAGINTIWIFKILNVFNLRTYISFEIYISIIWNILIFIILFTVKKNLEIKQFILIIISIIVLNIFDFTLAKEPIQMLFFIMIYIILISKKLSLNNKYILSLLIILFSAISFRKYYLIILFFIICTEKLCKLTIIKKEKIKIRDIMLVICLLGFIYFIILITFKILLPLEFNELIRVRTRVSEAASDMRNILPYNNNLIIFTFDYLIMIIRMLLPIELLFMGIKYIPYVFYQMIITYFLIASLKSIRKNSGTINFALFIFLGFLFGSAAFEPDFGSWIRHEAVLFPIFLILSKSNKSYER